MKKITASLAMLTLLLTGAAFAAEATAPDKQNLPSHPIKGERDKKRFRFKECDVNKDGVVTYEEYTACLPEAKKEFFDAVDADKDGKITREEQQAWREMKKKQFEEKRSERRIELFKKCDKDGNGSLSLEEFQACAPTKPGKKMRPGHKGDRPTKPGMSEGKAQ
jgi:Ca2+-binding protein (EF-Hand superfamily)